MIGITGATGFIGMCHLAYFIRRQIPVRILVRKTHPYATNPPPGAEVTVGNLEDPAALKSFADGLDVCFHYGGRASFKGDWARFLSANINGTENLLEACEKVPRFIFFSTQSVLLENRDIREADEDSPRPTQFVDAYAHSKAIAEETCLTNHEGATIIRPPWVWGAGDTNNLPTLLRPRLEDNFFFINGGTNSVETLHVGNLIHAANLVWKNDAAAGEIYFVTDEAPIESRRFSNRLLEACSLQPVDRSIPHLAATVLEWANRNIFQGKYGINKSSLIYMTREQTFSDNKIRRHMGYHNPIERDAGLEDLKSWCQYVGGAEKISVGRRRGHARNLVEQTWSYLLEHSTMFDQLDRTQGN